MWYGVEWCSVVGWVVCGTFGETRLGGVGSGEVWRGVGRSGVYVMYN